MGPVSTSSAAAAAIAPMTEQMRRAVHKWLLGRGWHGGTDQEIQDALDMGPQTECPRRLELAELGLVHDSGLTRPTRAGRKAVVWVATPRPHTGPWNPQGKPTDAPILNKRQMYGLLLSGALGNTVPQYMSLAQWEADPASARYPTWGVRTLRPGGPCAMYVPRERVPDYATRPEFVAAGVNISLMLDAVCDVTLYADVYDSPTGRIVYCVEHPGKGASWRKVMPERGRQLEGLAARLVLQRHLNAASLADLDALFERWPGHVVELSAIDRFLGTVPRRNAVCWEVRSY